MTVIGAGITTAAVLLVGIRKIVDGKTKDGSVLRVAFCLPNKEEAD